VEAPPAPTKPAAPPIAIAPRPAERAPVRSEARALTERVLSEWRRSALRGPPRAWAGQHHGLMPAQPRRSERPVRMTRLGATSF